MIDDTVRVSHGRTDTVGEAFRGTAVETATTSDLIGAIHTLEQRLNAVEEELRTYRRAMDKTRSVAQALSGAALWLRPKLGRLHQYAPRPLRVPCRKTFRSSKAPTISIVTPSYQQGDFLERTLASVLDQNYPGLQYIVQDGASTDGTIAVLKRYAACLAHYESKPDMGQSNAINLGFRNATGEIMAYLNSDDLMLPGSLAYVADYFARKPEVDAIYGHRIIIDEHDREIGRWILPPHDPEALKWADYVPQETLFWRRRLWERVGGVDESFRFAVDWDLLLRFQEANGRIVRVPRFLGAFRIHPAQKTSAEIGNSGAREMAILRRRSLGREVSDTEIHQVLYSYFARHVASDLLWRLRRAVGLEPETLYPIGPGDAG